MQITAFVVRIAWIPGGNVRLKFLRQSVVD